MKHTILSLLAVLSLSTHPVAAQTVDDILDVTVLTGWRNSDGTHTAGLQLELADGWKTYWRQPGDVGIPPQFEWANSKNIAAVDVKWPTPKVSWEDGARSIGYEGKVILPLIVTPISDGQIKLSANVLIGVCEEICIPVDMKISATLPAQGAGDQHIKASMAAQPVTQSTIAICTFQPASDGMILKLQLPIPQLGAKESVAIEIPDPSLWVTEPLVERSGDTLTATAQIYTADGNPVSIPRNSIRTTVLSNGLGAEFIGCIGG